MTQKHIEQNIKQLQEFFTEPNKLFNQLQQAHQSFLAQWNHFASEIPSESQKYLLEQQAKIQDLQEKISNSLKDNPNDLANLSVILFNYQTEQFASHIEKAKKRNEKIQELLSSYTRVEIPAAIKDVFQHTQDEIKRATSEAIKVTEDTVKATKEKIQTQLKDNNLLKPISVKDKTEIQKKPVVRKSTKTRKPATKKVSPRKSVSNTTTE